MATTVKFPRQNPYAGPEAQGAFTPESMAENEYVAQTLAYNAQDSANDKDEAAGVEVPPEWEDITPPPDPTPTPPPFEAITLQVSSLTAAATPTCTVTDAQTLKDGDTITFSGAVGDPAAVAAVNGATATVSGLSGNTFTASGPDLSAVDVTGLTALAITQDPNA